MQYCYNWFSKLNHVFRSDILQFGKSECTIWYIYTDQFYNFNIYWAKSFRKDYEKNKKNKNKTTQFWMALTIFTARDFSFMARHCNLWSRRNQKYKLHWRALNGDLRPRNIYNVRQRLRYCYYNSFSFQKLKGKFKMQCRDLS